MSDSTNDEFQKWKDKIQFLADEIRLQSHLASMEAKEAWAKLEPKVAAFESQVDEVSQEAVENVAKKLKDELERFKRVYSGK